MRIGAVSAGLLAVAVGLVLVLSEAKPRQAGTNYVPEVAPVLTIKGSGSHCQRREVVPGDSGALRLLVGTYERPLPALGVTVRAGARTISSGRLPAGGHEGHVTVPIQRIGRLADNATVCVAVTQAGRGRRTVLYGSAAQLRFEWLRPGSESWFALVPTVAHRFGLGRPIVGGSWGFLFATLLLAGAWLVGLRLALRELSS